MLWPCEPQRAPEIDNHVHFLIRVRVVQELDCVCTCNRRGTLVFGQHREQSRKGCTMPRKKGLPEQRKCGQCKASMMHAAFTEKEWQKKEANDRVCRACMDAVRADAGVSGQTGRLPKGAKDALLSVALSTSFHRIHRSPVLTRKPTGTTPHRPGGWSVAKHSPVSVDVGLQWPDTARLIASAMTASCSPRPGRTPRVTRITRGLGFSEEVPSSVLGDASEFAAQALHGYIRDQISSQFDRALHALLHGHFSDAQSLADACLHARGRPEDSGASGDLQAPANLHLHRDLNEAFSNRALAMCISAIASMAIGVQSFNKAPDLRENRWDALYHLQEGWATLEEVLEGSDRKRSGAAVKWVTETSHAGAAFKHNISQIVSAGQQIALIIKDHIRKNPILEPGSDAQ